DRGRSFRTFAAWRIRSRLTSFLRKRRQAGFTGVGERTIRPASLNQERLVDGKMMTMAAILEAEPGPDPDARLDAATVLDQVKPRQRQVLEAIAGGATAAELAAELGRSRTRIRQIVRQAATDFRKRRPAAGQAGGSGS